MQANLYTRCMYVSMDSENGNDLSKAIKLSNKRGRNKPQVSWSVFFFTSDTFSCVHHSTGTDFTTPSMIAMSKEHSSARNDKHPRECLLVVIRNTLTLLSPKKSRHFKGTLIWGYCRYGMEEPSFKTLQKTKHKKNWKGRIYSCLAIFMLVEKRRKKKKEKMDELKTKHQERE